MTAERDTEPLMARLRELTGTRLYAANAFRVLGLPADAGRQAIRRTQQRLAVTASLGGGEGEKAALGAAVEVLADPRRRIVDELFGVWGEPGKCGCPAALHRAHDDAVARHAAVVADEATQVAPPDAEAVAALDRAWDGAATTWTEVLDDETTWAHLRHRVEVLADPRLPASAVDLLREDAGPVLVAPLIELAVAAPDPERLVQGAYDWPVTEDQERHDEAVDELLAAAAEPFYAEVLRLVAEVRTAVDETRPDPDRVQFDAPLRTALARLRVFCPPEEHRRTAEASDMTAVVMNNVAMAVAEPGRVQDGVDTAAIAIAQDLLDEAWELTADPELRAGIRKNRLDTEYFELYAEVGALMRGNRVGAARRLVDTWIAADTTPQGDVPEPLSELSAMVSAAQGQRSADTGGRVKAGINFAIATAVLVLFIVGIVNGSSSSSSSTRHTYTPYPTPDLYTLPSTFTYPAGALPTIDIPSALLTTAPILVPLGPSPTVDPSLPKRDLLASDVNARPAPGSCLADADSVTADPHQVPIISCRKPHWGEVVGYPLLAATAYPGASAAELACYELPQISGLPQSIFVEGFGPTESEWRTSTVHYGACVAVNIDDSPLTGPLP